ncbi:TetR/AcrR family transcriptional regulator [Ignatzschineria rhizosphaerae]|uniref:TetR/AcrR family transcriptional regulator n=1 Tax=Ignatzschineria rhizosphaerae TaxID=2923279 RepID=A0ABY3X1Z3_9GAMM|nr:TetR/AcrR family transcriptional regulator [Ignatzschineria rhizosphaerae]UNM96893.1 TetR/AcrR family transcriptional regulator [Ignatzschineria rhizosphaerae]
MEPINKTEQTILQVSENLFSQHGWQRVSISEICDEAKVSRVTFYRYFKNKNALLKHIFLQKQERVTAHYATLLEESKNIEEVIKGIFSYQENALNQFFTPNVLKDFDQNQDPELIEFFQMQHERKYHFLDQFFSELQAKKIIDADYPTVLIHQYLKTMDHLMFNEVVQEAYGENKSTLRQDILKLIMFGLSGPKK